MRSYYKLALVGLLITCLFIGIGCATPIPTYKLDSGEQINLINKNNTASYTYQQLLTSIDNILSYVLPYTKKDSSEIDAMQLLHNKLEEMGIKTAFVAINVENNEPFYTCITVDTTDRGLVFIGIVEQSIGTSNKISNSEYIQAVYLQKGQKIGFVEAKYAHSSDYSWYTQYLTHFYRAMDFGKYVDKYYNISETNKAVLTKIKQNLDTAYDYLDRFKNQQYYWSPSDTLTFNRSADNYETMANRYNHNTEIFNAQIADYNSELERYNLLQTDVSSVIYYVEEIRISPSNITYKPVIMPPYNFDISKYTMSMPATYFAPTLTMIENSLSFDDSYNQIPKPDIQSVDKFGRLSDDNFVVNDFTLWW